MNSTEFNDMKKKVLQRPICYREVEAREIVAMGDNRYAIGGTAFEVDTNIADEIDRFFGIRKRQTRMAHDSYGEQGRTSLRNFFGQGHQGKDRRIILAANTDTKEIVEAIPIKNRMITPDVFFDFAELFMHENQYIPERVEYIHEYKNGVSILMRPVNEQFMEYAPGDEFLSNGIYLKWTPDEINVGNYYNRLICENGATQMSQHSITKAHAPEVEELRRLLTITPEDGPLKQNTDMMLNAASIAMKTTASVRELGTAVRILNENGVSSEDANQMIPFLQIKEKYKLAGYPTDSEHLTQQKSDRTMWELFNTLTFFATHNRVWSPHDIRRTSLMEASMTLLNRQRDIKEYFSIF